MRILKTVAAALIGAGIAASAGAQTTMQFPTTPWGGFAPGEVECGRSIAANMNTTGDTAIPLSVPTGGGGTYFLTRALLSNASLSLNTASGGLYTAASKGGTALASNQALSTLTAAAVGSAGSAFALSLAVGATTAMHNSSTLYFSLTTPQGAAATADIRLYCAPMY